MYEIEFKNSFKRDFKLAMKRGLNEDKLEEVLIILRDQGLLPARFKPHRLREIMQVCGNAISSQTGY